MKIKTAVENELWAQKIGLPSNGFFFSAAGQMKQNYNESLTLWEKAYFELFEFTSMSMDIMLISLLRSAASPANTEPPE